MKKTQDPKYGINDDGQICNMVTGVPIPDDEPVFMFRAQDVFSPIILSLYHQYCATDEHKTAVWNRIEDFKRFQADNPDRVKTPDTVLFPPVSNESE